MPVRTPQHDVGGFAPGRGRHAITVLRSRLPFTSAITAVMVLSGLLTGSLWDAANDREWFGQIAYGLPALVDGSWWTPFTGAFFALEPTIYLPMAGSFALLVGFTEWRLGSRTAVLATVVGHLAGVFGAAFLLWLVPSAGWSWAQEISGHLDVGLSAGALACLAVVAASLPSPWRLRLSAALVAYVVVSFLFIGALADLEHLIAVAVALPVGGIWYGRQRRY